MKTLTAEQTITLLSGGFVAIMFLVQDIKDFGWWGVIVTIISLGFVYLGWRAGKKRLEKHSEHDERLIHLRDHAAAVAYLVVIYAAMIMLMFEDVFAVHLTSRTAIWILVGLSVIVYALYYYVKKRS